MLPADLTDVDNLHRLGEVPARPEVGPCWSTTPAWPPTARSWPPRPPQVEAMVAVNVAATAVLRRRAAEAFAARGVDVCVVFPGAGAHPDAGSGPGRPIAPATRVGRDLERGWFMDPSVCVALAGFRTGA